MEFEKFKRNVLAYLEKAGISETVEFEHDADKKLYSAWVPGEEILLSCNESGLGMSVRFRSHTYRIPA